MCLHKEMRKIRYFLSLKIEHKSNGILIHQSAYVEKILERFYMYNAYQLNTHMLIRILDSKKDPFRQLEDGEKILGPEVPYLNAIGALLYLVQCTRPYISHFQ